MPKYTIVQFRDACVRYEVALEAPSAEAALARAKSGDCAWIHCGVSIYDNADMEVRDKHGAELIAAHEVW